MKTLTIILSSKDVLKSIKDGEFVDCVVSKKETARSMIKRDISDDGEIIIQVDVKSTEEVYNPDELKVRVLK